MSIETIYKCDHCGTRCSGDERATIAEWKEPTTITFGKAVHGCSKEHLGIALAKMFGIGVNGEAMTNRVHFYGDASLPGARHCGHFVYAPERNGVPVYMCLGIPRELWGKHECDHDHLLPWVPVRPEHRVCREREFGNEEHHHRCACSEGRTEGQAPGTAKITYTANYTALACWDYTGDMRGNSWSLFWVKGRLSTNDMISAIRRDFPRLWARITKPFGMATHGGDVDPAPAHHVTESVVEQEAMPTTSIDEIFPGLWESLVGTTIDLTQEAATPSVHERAKTA